MNLSLRQFAKRQDLVRKALYLNWVSGYNKMLLRDYAGNAREFIDYDEYKRRYLR